jgi:ribose-phosphate pyrophosphokinase
MKYEKILYPDGSFYAKIIDYGEPMVITERINSYNDLWFIKQLKDAMDHQGLQCHLSIPCLLDAQADRRFNSNESSNLKLVCDFINELEFVSVTVFHPHNPEVVENLIDNCVIRDNRRFIQKVLADIGKDQDELILFSTDAGGFKPLMKLADKMKWEGEVYSANKSRKWANGKSSLVQQIDRSDFQGKSILIIDDLCVYGGTFIGLRSLLADRNVGELYLAVSHMTVPNPNPHLSEFTHVFTTDSKYDSYDLFNLTVFPHE